MPDFEIDVTNLYAAQKAMQEGWASHYVSALGKADVFPSMGNHHLVLEFDDTEVEDPSGKWVAIQRSDIERLFDFTKNLEAGDRLLIHCRAGKSRSTALMMGVLVQHVHSPEEAFQIVKALRPMLIPNRRIIDLIDEVLGSHLTPIVADYYKGLMIPGVHLPDRGGANL